jgi:hypothetical protein
LEKNPIEGRKKYWTTGPKPPKAHGKRCTVIGTITSEGLLLDTFSIIESGHSASGDYHETMNGECFKNWLRKSIPIFKQVAANRKIAFVMDNAPYHSTKCNASPKMSSRKQEMVDFLEVVILSFE